MPDTPPWRSAGLTRKAQAHAYISWCLVERGCAPSNPEIGRALGVSETRARQLVQALSDQEMITRQNGAKRGIGAPGLVAEMALGRLKQLGWVVDEDAKRLLPPACGNPQLPVITRLDYLPPEPGEPGIRGDQHGGGNRRRARKAARGAPRPGPAAPEGEGDRAA